MKGGGAGAVEASRPSRNLAGATPLCSRGLFGHIEEEFKRDIYADYESFLRIIIIL
jgi:hypothetical protein